MVAVSAAFMTLLTVGATFVAAAPAVPSSRQWRAVPLWNVSTAMHGEWEVTTMDNAASLRDPRGDVQSVPGATVDYGPIGSHMAVLTASDDSTFLLIDPASPRTWTDLGESYLERQVESGSTCPCTRQVACGATIAGCAAGCYMTLGAACYGCIASGGGTVCCPCVMHAIGASCSYC